MVRPVPSNPTNSPRRGTILTALVAVGLLGLGGYAAFSSEDTPITAPDLASVEHHPIGARVNGTMVDIHLVEGRETNDTAWRWVLNVYYHNGTMPVTIRFTPGLTERGILWDGETTHVVLESTFLRPRVDEPIIAVVQDEEGRVLDTFAWCCDPGARNDYS